MAINRENLGTLGWAAAVAFLSALVLLAFMPALDNQLMQTWDTYEYVIQNPNVHGLSSENLWWMLSASHSSNWHPLTWLSHAIDYQLFGTNPFGHHLVSVVIHGLNTLLVFLLTWVLMKEVDDTSDTQRAARHFVAAAITAALFGVHPQHVESVVWVAERKDVLCLFFSLLTLLGYTRFVRSEGRSRLRWYLGTLLAFSFALMSKPMAVTLPMALLLLDVYPLCRLGAMATGAHRRPLAGIFLEKLPFFLLAVLSALITIWAQHGGGSVSSLAAHALDARILNAFNSLVFYLSKLIIPIGLSPFYEFPTAQGDAFSAAQWIPVAAVGLITALTVVAWRRGQPFWLLAWMFYGITLAPVLGIVQVGSQAAADRYTYLATLPFMMLAGAGFSFWLFAGRSSRAIKWAAIAGAMAIVLLLAQLTRKQSDVWQSDITLWSRVVQLNPASAYGRFRLGDAFMVSGRPEPAVRAYRSAQSLDPGHLWYGVNLPAALIRTGRYQEALDQVEILLSNDVTGGRGIDTLLVRRAEALIGLGRSDEAGESLREALSLNPGNERARSLAESL